MPATKESEAAPSASDAIVFRHPVSSDGPAVTALIAACPPLDRNSRYCNLIQCTHFAATCVVAEKAGRIIGWVSGHRPPSEPDSYFVWQVAVATEGRGQRLANRMIRHLMAQPAQRDVKHVIATVTHDNAASWALFEGLARDWRVALERRPHFERDEHFAGAHDTEFEARIGPLPQSSPEPQG